MTILHLFKIELEFDRCSPEKFLEFVKVHVALECLFKLLQPLFVLFAILIMVRAKILYLLDYVLAQIAFTPLAFLIKGKFPKFLIMILVKKEKGVQDDLTEKNECSHGIFSHKLFLFGFMEKVPYRLVRRILIKHILFKWLFAIVSQPLIELFSVVLIALLATLLVVLLLVEPLLELESPTLTVLEVPSDVLYPGDELVSFGGGQRQLRKQVDQHVAWNALKVFLKASLWRIGLQEME